MENLVLVIFLYVSHQIQEQLEEMETRIWKYVEKTDRSSDPLDYTELVLFPEM